MRFPCVRPITTRCMRTDGEFLFGMELPGSFRRARSIFTAHRGAEACCRASNSAVDSDAAPGPPVRDRKCAVYRYTFMKHNLSTGQPSPCVFEAPPQRLRIDTPDCGGGSDSRSPGCANVDRAGWQHPARGRGHTRGHGGWGGRANERAKAAGWGCGLRREPSPQAPKVTPARVVSSHMINH